MKNGRRDRWERDIRKRGRRKERAGGQEGEGEKDALLSDQFAYSKQVSKDCWEYYPGKQFSVLMLAFRVSFANPCLWILQ